MIDVASFAVSTALMLIGLAAITAIRGLLGRRVLGMKRHSCLDCAKPIEKRGRCAACFGLTRRAPVFWERIDASGDCWLWTGPTNGVGYGRFWIPDRRHKVYAHRAVWEALVGPIPEGMTLDHLCRVRLCVNPDHLEIVSNADNIRRGYAVPARIYANRMRKLAAAA